MISPLQIATEGYLCNTLSVAASGYLCVGITITPGPEGPIAKPHHSSRGGIMFPALTEFKQTFYRDDEEVLLIIKLFLHVNK